MNTARDEDSIAAARAAKAAADEQSAARAGQWGTVHQLAAELRARRETNHFAEMIRKALRGNT